MLIAAEVSIKQRVTPSVCCKLLVGAVVIEVSWFTLGWAARLWTTWSLLTATWLWWAAWIAAVIIAIAAAACQRKSEGRHKSET